MTELPWKIRPGLPDSVVEIAVAVVRAAAESLPVQGRVIFPTSALLAPLDSAEALNNENADRRPFVRRILRKQGRISRRAVEAAAVLVGMLAALPSRRGNVLMDAARRELDAARAELHLPHGNFLKRLRRPQHRVNEHFCAALTHVCSCVLDGEPSLAPSGGENAKLVEDIRWHVKEASFQSAIGAGKNVYLRRLRCNQYEINRCQIISIRLMARLVAG